MKRREGVFANDEKREKRMQINISLLRLFFGAGEGGLAQRLWKNGCCLWLGSGCFVLEPTAELG